MSEREVLAAVRDLDHRMTKVEQVLLTLPRRDEVATKEELERCATKEDLERSATKEDLKRCATKEDLERFATKEDLERFATKEDLARHPTRDEMQRGFDDLRTHMRVLYESLRDDIKLVIEVMTSRFDRLEARMDLAEQRGNRHELHLGDHERRITTLEKRRRSTSR